MQSIQRLYMTGSVFSMLALFLLAGGCSQSMRISVERLNVPNGQATQPTEINELRVYLTGTIAHEVALSQAALQRTKELIAEYESDRSSSRLLQPMFTADSRGYPDLDEAISRGDDVNAEIDAAALKAAGYLNAPARDRGSLYADLAAAMASSREYLDDVEKVFEDVLEVNQANLRQLHRVRQEVRDQNANADNKQRQIRAITALTKSLEEVPSASAAFRRVAEAANRPRFGGYSSETVHTISPGDPAYAYVLNARPAGKPISMVSSTAWGDSTIMFVQESPTQLRVFTVDVDGTQLAQNIMLITDKALQAAVNHLSPIPLGGSGSE